jgi:hypothetical protein
MQWNIDSMQWHHNFTQRSQRESEGFIWQPQVLLSTFGFHPICHLQPELDFLTSSFATQPPARAEPGHWPTSTPSQLWLSFRMDPTHRALLIRQRSVVKASLTRRQTLIESGDRRVNEIQVTSDDLQGVFNRYDTAQNELEISDDTDHFGDWGLLENQYSDFKAKFNELLHPVVDPPLSRHSSPRNSLSGHTNNSPHWHASSTHIKLPVIELPTFDCNACNWLHFRDTLEALIVNNKTLSNVQKFHHLIASLKNEAKDLITNLQITNGNFSIAWQLVKQWYKTIKPIVMKHVKHSCQMPQIQRRDTASLGSLINHVSVTWMLFKH